MRSPTERWSSRARARAGGMTLVELAITVAILAMVGLAAANVSIGFQQQYAAANLKRQAADSARTALIWIERDLRLAGYGMDPALALDFNIWKGTTSTGETWCSSFGGNINSTNCRRDNGTAGIDELVFYARNPNYWGMDLQGEPEGQAWTVLGSANGSITLKTHGAEWFPKNQILQIVCPSAAGVLYASVAQTTQAALGVPTTLPTMPVQVTDPFRQDPGTLVCIGSGGARAFLIERYRYYVDPNMRLGDATLGSVVPTLVLDKGTDRNLDSTIDTQDTIKVSPGIIDLQLAYARPTPPPGGSPPNTPGTLARVGATLGSPLALCRQAGWPFLSATVSIPCANGLGVLDFTTAPGAKAYGGPPAGYGFTELPLLDARRQSPFNATIAEVQISVVSRSIPRWRSRQNPTIARNVLPPLLNRNAGTTTLPYELYVGDTAVPLRNLRTRALSFF